MDFAVTGGTITFMLVVAALHFVILYFVIRAAVRDGQIEAHKFLHDDDSNNTDDEDAAIYKLHQQLNNKDNDDERG